MLFLTILFKLLCSKTFELAFLMRYESALVPAYMLLLLEKDFL